MTRTSDTRESARETLEEWIEANPYGETINWASPMEAALRILTFTWLFHALGGSEAWRDRGFRVLLLRTVYLHGDFVARNLELSDVNGNHLDADAAGIVFAGLFFGAGRAPARWAKTGWSLLLAELPRQVTPDGVDFEMSTAYHRLVTELFLLPALLRRRLDLPVPGWYLGRLEAMARFAAAYSRSDGSSPAWGDADDARALPLGGQPLGDHRYLGAVMAAAWSADVPVSGSRAEAAWLLGPTAAAAPSRHAAAGVDRSSRRAAARCCEAATITCSSTAATSGSPAAAATAITTSRRSMPRSPESR